MAAGENGGVSMWWIVFQKLSFYAAVCSFIGTCLIAYGFRVKALPTAKFGDFQTGRMISAIGLDAELLWVGYLGWALVIAGFALQVANEALTAIRSN